MRFMGLPYPVTKNPLGLFRTTSGLNQIKSDLLVLLLTTPGERPMLPAYGTPLKTLIFDQNDIVAEQQARQMIINSINAFEPRITVDQISVSSKASRDILAPGDSGDDIEHILEIKITFFDPQDINEVDELVLQVPTA